VSAARTDEGRRTTAPPRPPIAAFRPLSWIARLLPLLAVIALAAALLALAIGRPARDAVDVGAPGDAYALASFYRPDTSDPTTAGFRWSGPGSRLLLPAASDGPLALELRLHGPAFAPPEALRLTIERDGRAVAELTTTPAWRVYRLLLPPDATPEPAPLRMEPLDLLAPPAYGPGDPRPLGVALDSFAIEGAPGPASLRSLLARALPLAWALGLLAACGAASGLKLRHGPHPLAPSPFLQGRGGSRGSGGGEGLPGGSAPSVPLWWTAGGLALAGALLALWAWRNPLGFAWAVPTPPLWLLGAATLALALSAGIMHILPQWRNLQSAIGNRQSILASLLAAHLLLLAPAPWSGLGALGILLTPGALAARTLFPEERRPLTALFLALCGALAVAPLLVLALHAVPGPLPGWALVLAADALAATLLVSEGPGDRGQGAGASEEAGGRGEIALLALVLLVAAGLRLWRLGGAEFQGDEARAMLLAAGVAQGADGILLTHTKGPIEALLPAGPLAIAGVGAEWVARLPFALASLGALLGALALLREWGSGGRAAAGALSLLAVDGFSVGFGRIVQYQSVVLLAMAGALWCCWRFYAGAPGPARHLAAAATLLALGLLAHYDAALVTPALAWLVVAGGLRRGWRGWAWARGLAGPAALGLALLAAFYVPYALGPSFAGTADYLAGRAGEGDAGGPPFNNLGLYLDILAFYNAPPLIPLLAAATLGAIGALLVSHVRPRPLALALAALLGLAALTQWLAPGLFLLPGGESWAALAFAAPLAGLWLAPAVPAPVRAAALWFGVALCAEAFLIAEPRTHFYTAHVPAALLVGLALAKIADRSLPPQQGGAQLPGVRTLALVVTLVLLVGGGLYAQLLYLRQFPEYQRAFPAARPNLLRARYGDTLPEAGYFGFPHRDGWKAVAELYRAGALQGSYDTNQNRWLAGWYVQGLAPQCKGRPDLYLIAEAEPTVYFPPGYHLVAEVLTGPARALAIYGQAPAPGGPQTYRLEDLAPAFDARPAPALPATQLLTEEPARCP
jgi:hypothetical protein